MEGSPPLCRASLLLCLDPWPPPLRLKTCTTLNCCMLGLKFVDMHGLLGRLEGGHHALLRQADHGDVAKRVNATEMISRMRKEGKVSRAAVGDSPQVSHSIFRGMLSNAQGGGDLPSVGGSPGS